MAEPLAVQSDVEAALGRVLTESEVARIEGILLKASALFRREAKQEFTAGSSTVRLKVNGGRVYLPQCPVTAVTAVVDDRGEAVEYERAGQWLTVCLGSDKFVTVAYSHGDDEVPDLVRLTIAEVGAKVLSMSAEALQGVSSYTNTDGPFTETRTYAGWSQGGQTTLSPEDKAVAQSFRVRVPTIHVMSSQPSTDPLPEYYGD